MRELGALIGGVGSLLVVPWIFFMLGLSVAFPFMVISVVKNVARMRRALERIADANEYRAGTGGSGVLKL